MRRLGFLGWCSASVGVMLLLASPTWAGPAHCFGPYAITATGAIPAAAGDDVRDWTGDVTVNLKVTSGSLSLDVEGKLDGGDWGTFGTVTTTSVSQFHGPLDRLRHNVTACMSCVATIVTCANKGD